MGNNNSDTLLNRCLLRDKAKDGMYGGSCELYLVNFETEVRNINETCVNSDSEDSEQQNDEHYNDLISLPLLKQTENYCIKHDNHIKQLESLSRVSRFKKSMMMDTANVCENNGSNLHKDDQNYNLNSNEQNLSHFSEADDVDHFWNQTHEPIYQLWSRKWYWQTILKTRFMEYIRT